MFCPQPRILFSASLMSSCFCIIRTPSPIKIWSPEHVVRYDAAKMCNTETLFWLVTSTQPVITNVYWISENCPSGTALKCPSLHLAPVRLRDIQYTIPFALLSFMCSCKLHLCKLQWYGHVSRSSGLAKTTLQGTVKGGRRQTTLQGTVKGGRRQGRQRKRWEDNIRAWTGPESAKSHRAVGDRGKNGENWLRNHLWCPNDPRG